MSRHKKRKNQASGAAGAGTSAKPGISAPRLFGKSTWAGLVVFVAVFLTFLPIVRNGFISFDDGSYVTQNVHVQKGLSWDGLGWALRTTATGNWHPLTWLSHMLDCQIFGLRPWGHHLTSVFVHALNSTLVFLLFRNMTGAFGRSIFLAALFGLHPLRVESVAWAAERKDVLSVFFFLLTIWAYVKYVSGVRSQISGMGVSSVECRGAAHAPHSTLPAPGFYLLSLILFALGLMSKPMLVTLPFVLLLLDYWPLGRVTSDEWRVTRVGASIHAPRSTLHALPSYFLDKFPFFLLAAISSVVTFIVQRQAGATTVLQHLSWIQRTENAFTSYLRYLQKLLWPQHLAIFYPYPSYWPIASVLLAVCLLAAVSFLAIRFRREQPYVFVGWLWFVGTLIPVIGLVQVGRQAMADRYTYIPSIGICLVVVWGVADMCRSWFPSQTGRTGQTGQTPLVVAGVLLVMLSAVLTIHQIGSWRDSETLFRHANAVAADNYLAHANLGFELQRQGRSEEAIKEYEEALRIKADDVNTRSSLVGLLASAGRSSEAANQARIAIEQYQAILRSVPNDVNARNSLGSLLLSIGQNDEAVAQFQTALSHAPDFSEAHNNLGYALERQGRLDAAAEQFQLALQGKPDDVHIRNNLAAALLRLGRHDDAIRQLRQILTLTPADILTRKNLASELINTGQVQEGINQFEEVLQSNPADAEAHRALGLVLQSQGRLDQAISHLRQAVSSNPRDPTTLNLLGYALQLAGQTDQAIGMFDQALRLDPNLEAAHNNLGVALESKGRTEEAIGHFQQAIRLNPNSAEAHGSLGLTLAEAGRREEAITELNQALKLRPDYPEAAARLRALKQEGLQR
jgi:tetratricopeptide (TPR) repeat protein